jgi:hypothetical protein
MASNVAKVVRAVGIGHFQTRHDLAFEAFHRLSLCVGLVIVAIEVEKPMHREVSEVMKKVAVLISALPFERLESDHYIAEQPRALADVGTRGGKRQNVGRLIDTAPIPVERADRRIVSEHNTDFTSRC